MPTPLLELAGLKAGQRINWPVMISISRHDVCNPGMVVALGANSDLSEPPGRVIKNGAAMQIIYVATTLLMVHTHGI